MSIGAFELLRELGWRNAGDGWSKQGAPIRCVSSREALHYELREALARAGRAEHEADRLANDKLNQSVSVVVLSTILTAATVGLFYFLSK